MWAYIVDVMLFAVMALYFKSRSPRLSMGLAAGIFLAFCFGSAWMHLFTIARGPFVAPAPYNTIS